jgi:hypothetical protein
VSACQHAPCRALSAFQLVVFTYGRMLDSRWVNVSANRYSAKRSRVVPRLIASSPTTVAATTAIASPTVEPATVISVVTTVSVSETPVVAARRPTSPASTATTGAENVAHDHGDHDYRHDYEEHSHPNSPFTGFPQIQASLPGSTTPL